MTSPYSDPARVDWSSLARTSQRALGIPTLLIVGVGAVLTVTLVLLTLSLDGAGAWVLRVLVLLLAAPVALLAITRQRVIGSLRQMERTGEHPDNVVTTVAPDGTSMEIVVADSQRTIVPRIGLGRLGLLSLGAVVANGVLFALVVVVALALAL